ncbi:MAG: hypothetical protein M3O70_03970 [Actinomycetota bacterium]|nr:hypothetical protein [Actinomycetota bacterium]
MASVTLLLLASDPASSSCIRDDRPLSVKVAEAEIVFVGTVLSVADARRTARVHVEEVWRGPELDEQVVVHGGADDAFSSVDRHWEPGARYLVFPRQENGRLQDDACSPTIPWEPQLATFRPDDAQPIEPQSGRVPTTARPTEWVFAGSAVIVLVLGIGWLLRRHARRPPADG